MSYFELKEFCEMNKRMPVSNRSREENRLYHIYYRNSDRPEFKELHDKYSSKQKRYSYSELLEFCERNKRMPVANKDDYENALYAFFVRHNTEKKFIDLYDKYSKKRKSFTIEDLEKFCEEHNRLPRSYYTAESDNERLLFGFYSRHIHKPEFIKLREKYGGRCNKCSSKQYRYSELLEFCEKNKRMPTANKGSYEKALYAFFVRHNTEEKFIDLRNKYGKKRKSFTIKDLEKFCEEHNRLPRGNYASENNDERLLFSFFCRYKHKLEFIKLQEKYGRRL